MRPPTRGQILLRLDLPDQVDDPGQDPRQIVGDLAGHLRRQVLLWPLSQPVLHGPDGWVLGRARMPAGDHLQPGSGQGRVG